MRLFSFLLLIFGLSACNLDLPSADGPNFSSLEYFYLAQEKHNHGKFDTAYVLYTAAIETAPEEPEFYYERGRVLYDMDRYKEALADYAQAIKLEGGGLSIIMRRRSFTPSNNNLIWHCRLCEKP